MTGTITKKSVRRAGMEKLFYVTVNFTAMDGTTEVINKDFQFEYRPGDNVTLTGAKLLAEIQAEVTNYKAEQALFTAAKFDTLVTSLNAGVVY
jgi:hypothetical protein